METLQGKNSRTYEAPMIEALQIEMEQNILGGSGTIDDLPLEEW